MRKLKHPTYGQLNFVLAASFMFPTAQTAMDSHGEMAASQNHQELAMSFLIYLAGFAILIGGVAWALVTAGVPHLYVLIASVIMLGLGIVTGVARTRNKDSS